MSIKFGYAPVWKSSLGNRTIFIRAGFYTAPEVVEDAKLNYTSEFLREGYTPDGMAYIGIWNNQLINAGAWGVHGKLGPVLIVEGPAYEHRYINGQEDFEFPCPWCGCRDGVRGRDPEGVRLAFRYDCGSRLVFGGEQYIQKIDTCKETK